MSPFHDGEREAQTRAGVAEAAAAGGAFIRERMPDQHRAFFAGLPFLVVAGGDAQGRTWASVIEGPEGFATSPHPGRLDLARGPGADDPLAARFAAGGEIGLLGIELATRRRNRVNGRLRREGGGFALEVRQSFGNCPSHIRPRERRREAAARPGPARVSDALSAAQAAWIGRADTMFLASGWSGEAAGEAAGGYDASHRGGPAGFVRVEGARALSFPDYAGNNYFNTLGNLLRDPRVGLVFVDFATGSLLHLTGRAEIDWHAQASADPDARRLVRIAVEQVIERPGALSLRWRAEEGLRLRVTGRTRESADVVSFHLAPADGAAPPPFRPGQHLPVALSIPGQAAPARRSYSLSGPGPELRISVKREARGLVSRFLHDRVAVGDVIEAGQPAGDFVLPDGEGPLVLAGAGVGATPLLAMLHAAVREGRRPVRFVHGVRAGRDHAFRAEVAALVGQGGDVAARTLYSRPEPEDRRAGAFDAEGRITAADLLAAAPEGAAEFLLCGPAGFLADLRAGLEAAGVPAARIHEESFGPAG
ncbi:pyridoxamine 5'-phosphate oxidase family protein [Albimonas pacifica]|uniref:FAD-binding FR-type domain-containing protein n=1 Tax=Albimonas pacifica TaxID=1114924 RepID=A0A1I3CJU8_9RHOB|nr:pyridoxamine 5'-phosphate oxidase family protein [Albimonas pacifica]SFH74539.1 hypothetical protein SAMN05216258_10230 [Albimonas pacifica]